LSREETRHFRAQNLDATIRVERVEDTTWLTTEVGLRFMTWKEWLARTPSE
jgi:hypothetical protein